MRITKTNILLLLLILFCINGFSQVKVKYEPSDNIIFNPERGFYTQLTSQAEKSPLTLDILKEIKSKGQSLILRMYYLKKFRDKKLSKAELDLVRNDFKVLRKAGMKEIVRFAYSQKIGKPDAPLSIILKHIQQLKSILRANSDVIAVMQAGFIGAWGEWHSSTNGLDTNTNRKKILFAVLNALPKTRMVQVRTPHFKREIFNRKTPLAKQEAYSETMYSRVGHHNDCFVADWSDYGTYTDTVEEKNYLAHDCMYVPMGGETCNPCSYSDCGNTIYQMKRLHWSFINSGYHPIVIRGWKSGECINVIKKEIGYRLELLSGEYSDSLKPGEAFKYNIKLTNTGFASLYNPRNVELILKNYTNSQKYAVKLPVDPRFWKSGDTLDVKGRVGVPLNIFSGEYSVYLNLPDPEPLLHNRPDYSIQFANKNTWERNTGYNNLMFHLFIMSGKAENKYNGKLIFHKL